MSDPYVRDVGSVQDIDGYPVRVGVNYDTVTVSAADSALTREMAGEFGRLFAAACWEAGANARRMADETPSTPLNGSSQKIGREWCRIKPGVQGRLLSFGGVNDQAFAWIDVRPEAGEVSDG